MITKMTLIKQFPKSLAVNLYNLTDSDNISPLIESFFAKEREDEKYWSFR